MGYSGIEDAERVLKCPVLTGTGKKLIRAVAVLVPWLIFISAIKTNDKMGQSVPWRPPVATYIVAWVLLVACISFSWLIMNRCGQDDTQSIILNIGFCVVVALSTMWAFLYDLDKKNGVAVLVALIAVVGLMLAPLYSIRPGAAGLLIPLVVWGVFQLSVNCAELSYDQGKLNIS